MHKKALLFFNALDSAVTRRTVIASSIINSIVLLFITFFHEIQRNKWGGCTWGKLKM